MRWRDLVRVVSSAAALLSVSCAGGRTNVSRSPAAPDSTQVTFPLGTATPSEVCGRCHVAIYNEVAFGTGADLKWTPIIYKSLAEPLLGIPGPYFDTASGHHLAGVDPWPLRARDVENNGASCNTCHYPEPFDLPDLVRDQVMHEPTPRPRVQESAGVTCASCHLTPDGRIRGRYDPREMVAPHESVQDPNFGTAVSCAFCHSKGPRVVGKQTQTYYEWRDDYFNTGLGSQQCQDCHMPTVVRSLAEDQGARPRATGQHLWPGSHAVDLIRQALTLAVTQVHGFGRLATPIEIHVTNVRAGHSVPSGSNRRGIWLTAEIVDSRGTVVASNEWLFAPWYASRPDDRAFLQTDQNLPDAIAASQADAQGPHETPVRAGEERVLTWTPPLPSGTLTVRVALIYDLNRYNDRSFTQDQTELARSSMVIRVP